MANKAAQIDTHRSNGSDPSISSTHEACASTLKRRREDVIAQKKPNSFCVRAVEHRWIVPIIVEEVLAHRVAGICALLQPGLAVQRGYNEGSSRGVDIVIVERAAIQTH
jgi:hypothetical protein